MFHGGIRGEAGNGQVQTPPPAPGGLSPHAGLRCWCAVTNRASSGFLGQAGVLHPLSWRVRISDVFSAPGPSESGTELWVTDLCVSKGVACGASLEIWRNLILHSFDPKKRSGLFNNKMVSCTKITGKIQQETSVLPTTIPSWWGIPDNPDNQNLLKVCYDQALWGVLNMHHLR